MDKQEDTVNRVELLLRTVPISVQVDINFNDIFEQLTELNDDELFAIIIDLEESRCDFDFTKRLRDHFQRVIDTEEQTP